MPIHPPCPRFDQGDVIRFHAGAPPRGLPERAIVLDYDGYRYELGDDGAHCWFEVGLIDSHYEEDCK